MLFAKQGALVVTAIALAAATLGATGCGKSSKTTSTTTSTTAAVTTPSKSVVSVKIATGIPLTQAALVAKGDKICARLTKQLNAMTVRRPAEFAVVFPRAATYEQAEYDSLSKLTPPEQLKQSWKEFLELTVIRARNSVKVGEYLATHSFSAASPILRQANHEDANRTQIAKLMGFKACSTV